MIYICIYYNICICILCVCISKTCIYTCVHICMHVMAVLCCMCDMCVASPIHAHILHVDNVHMIYMCTYRCVCVGNRLTFCTVDVFCKVAMNLNWQILNHCSKGNILIFFLFVYLFNPHLRAFFSLHLEREKGREEGKERNITEREALIGCPPHTWTRDQGMDPQPRHMP